MWVLFCSAGHRERNWGMSTPSMGRGIAWHTPYQPIWPPGLALCTSNGGGMGSTAPEQGQAEGSLSHRAPGAPVDLWACS